MLPTYTIIRSKRKSLGIQVTNTWKVIARAPTRMSISLIEEFMIKKIVWIQKHTRELSQNIPKPILTKDEIKVQKNNLKIFIIPRIYELWNWKNLPKITSIKITQSERRWGSCSSKNWLCFSYRLAEYIDTPFIDVIIIHELAHLIEKNHQKPFWNLVYSWMPEYESVMRTYRK